MELVNVPTTLDGMSGVDLVRPASVGAGVTDGIGLSAAAGVVDRVGFGVVDGAGSVLSAPATWGVFSDPGRTRDNGVDAPTVVVFPTGRLGDGGARGEVAFVKVFASVEALTGGAKPCAKVARASAAKKDMSVSRRTGGS